MKDLIAWTQVPIDVHVSARSPLVIHGLLDINLRSKKLHLFPWQISLHYRSGEKLLTSAHQQSKIEIFCALTILTYRQTKSNSNIHHMRSSFEIDIDEVLSYFK